MEFCGLGRAARIGTSWGKVFPVASASIFQMARDVFVCLSKLCLLSHPIVADHSRFPKKSVHSGAGAAAFASGILCSVLLSFDGDPLVGNMAQRGAIRSGGAVVGSHLLDGIRTGRIPCTYFSKLRASPVCLLSVLIIRIELF